MAEIDNPTTEAPEDGQNATPAQGTDWKAEYEKLKGESRKWEERAKANKAKADAYDEQQKAAAETKKTLEQQVADIQAKLNASETKNTRLRIAAEKGVDAALLQGTTEDELTTSADALLAAFEAYALKKAPASAPVVPNDGDAPDTTKRTSGIGQFAHDFFGGN